MPAPLRIAYFSPLPPARSGIADYSADLLPQLATRAEVTLFANDPAQVRAGGLPIDAIANYPQRRWDFDLPLYHMGNSAHHEAIYPLICRYPGVMVLHDPVIHQFVAHLTSGQGNRAAYARELRYALGADGADLYDAIRLGQRPTPLAEVALNDRLLDASLATIVHSDYAKAQVMEQHPAARIGVIPQLIARRAGHSRRAELGLPDETILFGSIGQVTLPRQLPTVLTALRQVVDRGIPAHFLVVGEALPEVELADHITALGLEHCVTYLGYVADLDAFIDWTTTLDVVVNLRFPTLGETSASSLRAMDVGRPVIVSDHGWYSELPSDTVVKVPAEPDTAALVEAMAALAQDPALRERIGQAAKAYVVAKSHPDAIAEAYVDFLGHLREELWLGR